jgi:hypothetical protein
MFTNHIRAGCVVGFSLALIGLSCGHEDQESHSVGQHALVPSGNLTQNPSFETNTNGWANNNCSFARVSLADAPDGSWVLEMTWTGAQTYMTVDDTPNTVPSGSAAVTYEASAYVKASSASALGIPASIVIRERTAGGAVVVNSISPPVTLTSSFQRAQITYTTTVPANQVAVTVVVYVI